MSKRISTGPKREIRALTSEHELELRAEQRTEDGQTHLTGYTARYGILSDNLGTTQRPWKERIMPGAFTRALRDCDDIKHLQNHNPDIVLGSTKSGTTKLTEDARGLHFDTVLDVDDNMFARAVASSVRRRDVTGQSFGMIVSKGGDRWITEGGIDVREIHNIDILWDLSTVTNPAYPSTSVSAEMRMAQMFPDGPPSSVRKHTAESPTCDCSCGQCAVGHCPQCENEDCADEQCQNCPMQKEETEEDAALAPTDALPAPIPPTLPAPTAPTGAADEAKKTKRVDGEDLSYTDFIIVGDPSDPKTWKLAWRFSSLEKTKSHLRNALARFDQLKGISDAQKSEARTKLVRLCKKYGVKVAEEDSKKNEITHYYFTHFQANSGACECDCQTCVDGDCDSCVLEDCDDEDCKEAGCPMQKSTNHFEQFSAEDLSLHLSLRDPETRARLAALPGVEIRSKVKDDGILELYVYGSIGNDWWGGGMSAEGMRQAIAQADKHTAIRVCINSMGGDAFEGVAMYNLLRQQDKPITTRVHGMAASAASIIAMAGDTIEMGSNTMLMVHNAQVGIRGYAKDLRKQADVLDSVSGSIANTYVDRTGKSMAEVQKLMDEETWMSAFDAVRAGFATVITEDFGADVDDVDNELRSSPLAATYRNMPQGLVERRDRKPEVEQPTPTVPTVPTATTVLPAPTVLPTPAAPIGTDATMEHRKRLLALAVAAAEFDPTEPPPEQVQQ